MLTLPAEQQLRALKRIAKRRKKEEEERKVRGAGEEAMTIGWVGNVKRSLHQRVSIRCVLRQHPALPC